MSNIQTRQTPETKQAQQTQEKTPVVEEQQKQMSPEDQEKLAKLFGVSGKMAVGIVIVVVIFALMLLIFFNLGASVLSYHKYGSYFWATINFFFAGLYYPFYAFFLDTNTPPVAAPAEGMVGGVVKMLGGKRRGSRRH